MSTITAQEMDILQIKEILPHRYPFLLVDRVLECEPGKRAKGYKNMTANEEFFNGHFPFRPMMPGVLMVEALAQLGCICLQSLDEYRDALCVFAGIDGIKFRSPVVPGDRLDMEVELLKVRGPLGRARIQAKVGDKIACEGEIVFAVTRPNAEAKATT
ncbi:MAG TPA: 3-hydroxyacyl-ACP dehydratase FabZ [Chroococcales cyanobacterium]